jgi:cytochrome c oxidase assembly factor CtaG
MHLIRWARSFRHVVCGVSIALALVQPGGVALAHEGAPPAPHDLWRSWNLDPVIVAGLGLGVWLYGRGLRRLWRRAGVGRGVRRWQAAWFALGVTALAVALLSPLDPLGGALFSAHMVQHLVLSLIAAPLIVLSAPVLPFLWAVAPARRRALGRWWKGSTILRAAWHGAVHPLVAWLLAATALLVWHLPALYQAALRSELVHAAEHAGFFGSALLFWWTVVHAGGRRAPGHGWAILSIFGAAALSGALGVALTYAPSPWYPAYAATTTAWGLTPREDQQLAGLIMWIPAGMIYLLAALALLAGWAGQTERDMRRWEAAWER